MNYQDMYRQLAMKLHPDRGGSLEEMTKLNSAYQSRRWEIVETLYSKYFVVKTKTKKQYTQKVYYSKPKEDYTIVREVTVRKKYRKQVHDLFETVEVYARRTGAIVFCSELKGLFGKSQFIFLATGLSNETYEYLLGIFMDLSYAMYYKS
jgi:hypothetical protein